MRGQDLRPGRVQVSVSRLDDIMIMCENTARSAEVEPPRTWLKVGYAGREVE